MELNDEKLMPDLAFVGLANSIKEISNGNHALIYLRTELQFDMTFYELQQDPRFQCSSLSGPIEITEYGTNQYNRLHHIYKHSHNNLFEKDIEASPTKKQRMEHQSPAPPTKRQKTEHKAEADEMKKTKAPSVVYGTGEAIRLACAYGGLDLESLSNHVTGEVTFGQVPAQCVSDDQMILQSAAIMRYVGKLTGLYPSNDNLLAAKIDIIVDKEIDMCTGLEVSSFRGRFGFGFLTEDHVATVRKSLNDEILPEHLRNVEKVLEESTSGWVAGTPNPTIADFILVPRLLWLVEADTNHGISESLLEGYPRICALIKQLLALPAVVAYYEKHTKLHLPAHLK